MSTSAPDLIEDLPADRGTIPPPAPPTSRPGRLARLRRPTRSGWITAAIGVFTAGLYSWRLSSVGMGNSYYAAAVKAMSVNWKAFFFGSIDPGNFITVDKPPAALWVQALAARIFGFSSWSILLPEAAAGVGSVLILHHLVKRWAGDTAAHLSALAFALTPVALLMFRYNNPDAFLTLLGLAGAWAVWSALESGRTRPLLVAGAITGLAFQAKMLQAFLVLPAFGLVYLVAGPPKLGRRIVQLCLAGLTLLVSAGWWVAVVALWPAASRPFIGSTSDNSILSLIFGYNGLARLFGRSGPGGGGGASGPGGGGGGTGFGGSPSWLRMFNSANGGQIAWLLPLAALGLLAGLWATRRARRADLGRAGWILWGTWALVCYVVFSKAQGIYHPYYTVQLAPAAAALAGGGGVTLWRLGRTNRWLRMALPAALAVTGGWAVSLLDRSPTFHAWLRPGIVAGVALAAAGLWLAWQFRNRALLLAAGALAAVTMLAGPAAFAAATVSNASTGSIVAAGPGGGAGGFGGGGPGGGRAGGPGAEQADAALIAYLEANRGDATYLVAAFGSGSSAPIIIASGQPVMTIGGFNGGDPAPTLAQFEALVAQGKVRFVLLGGQGGGQGGPGGNGSSSITSWVTQHGSAVPAASYGGTGTGNLYDLAGAK
jgi:4-amino-4-deoxy-L-arabinose transferase-like glycosyltransferase